MGNDQKLVIGVRHSDCFFGDVVRYLKKEGVKGKNVMVELAKNLVPSEPSTKGPSFFRRLGDFIIENGGNLIYGDDEEILERAYKRNSEIYEEMCKPGLSFEDWMPLHEENNYVVPHIERDPHFLGLVCKKNPDIVILGRYHIPILVENYYSHTSLEYKAIYIPEWRGH